MLQIRLNRGAPGEGGGGGGGAKTLPAETVTVACPDHLVLADLPVAKGIGSITASSPSSVKSVGRRPRQHLGERVHFCVQCDFPIAIYGRLSPCEHAFCLACARSDASCYLCEERIQKIQTIKILEEIFICAAPHCFKSFLKRAEFEAHIHDTHADLLQPNVEKEDGNEMDNITRPSSADSHVKQPVLPDPSTARTQPRPSFSPNSNSQPQDREDRARRQQPKEPSTPKQPQLQPKQPPFYNRNPQQPSESQPDNPSQGFDRHFNRFQHHTNFDSQGGLHYRRDSEQFPDKQQGVLPEPPFPEYPPMHPHQSPNFAANANQGPSPPPQFNYPAFLPEGSQPFYNAQYEMPRSEMASEGGSEQGSLLGFPPAQPGAVGFPDSYPPRPWGMGPPGMSFEPLATGPGMPEGYANLPDSQGRGPFFQGDYGRFPAAMPVNYPPMGKDGMELQSGGGDYKDGKGVLAPAPLPPPPPLPMPLSQLKRGKFSSSGDMSREGQGYNWQDEKRGFGNSQD